MRELYNKFWSLISDKENRKDIFEKSSDEEIRDYKVSLDRVNLESLGEEPDFEKIRQDIKLEIRRRSKKSGLFIGVLRYASVVAVALFIGYVFHYIGSDINNHIEPIAEETIDYPKEVSLKLSDGKTVVLSNNTLDSLVDKDYNITYNKTAKSLDYSKGSTAPKKVVYNEIIVPRASEFSLKLSDGTTVFLNSETIFKYPVNFSGDKREVFIEGEAYFRVKKNKSKPFIVNVKDINVEVLGTSFNVNSYKENESIATTLVEGKVKVCKDNDKESTVILSPNEQAEYKDGKLSSRKVDIREYVSWVNGQFFFDDMSLEKVMIQIERWYDIDVFFMNEEIKDFEFTGIVERSCSLERMMSMIETITNCKLRLNNKTIIIEKN